MQLLFSFHQDMKVEKSLMQTLACHLSSTLVIFWSETGVAIPSLASQLPSLFDQHEIRTTIISCNKKRTTYHDDTFRSIKNVNRRLGIPRGNSYCRMRSERKRKHLFRTIFVLKQQSLRRNFSLANLLATFLFDKKRW